MTKSQVCWGLTCLSFGVFACEGEPELLEISSAQAALTATENAELGLQGVIDAADFLASSTSIAKTLSAFGASETCESSAAFCPDGQACPLPETTCTSEEISEQDLEEARQEIRQSATELVQELRERILIEANLEAATSTSATYRIGPDVLCSGDSIEEAPSAGGAEGDEAELDEDCVDRVTRLKPRLVLTSPREGDIDVTLLLGADRHAPLTLALHRESLGVRLDLGEGMALASDLGEDLEGVRELSGLLELRLVKNDARDYSLELNVLQALLAVVESDGERVTTSLGASSPAWNVRVNGNTDTLSVGMDLARLRVAGPLRLFADLFESDDGDDIIEPGDGTLGSFELGALPEPEERTYTGWIELFLSGLSGTLSYTANTDVLSLSDIGFGDETSTLEHDGDTLFGLDLNARQQRRVNLTVSPTENGTEIRITPTFDLTLAFAFHHIQDQFADFADYLLDDTLRVWFEGDAPVIELEDDRFRVTNGTLHLDSAADASANVSVGAGMCLASAADAEETSDDEAVHPLASLEATSCE